MPLDDTQELDVVTQGPAIDGSNAGQSSYAPEKRAEPPEERKALVKRILSTIKEDAKHWESNFKQMREDQKFARGKQWRGQTADDDRYVANITQRHIQQRVSSLYAKNPTAVSKRRQRMEYTIWDGEPESLAQAQQMLTMASQVAQDPAMAAGAAMQDPAGAAQMMQQAMGAQELMADIQQAQQRIKMYDRIGKTMVCLFQYYMGESQPPFKLRAKQLVRRVVTCGVGYIKLGFQRINAGQANPDINAKIADFTTRLDAMRALSEKVAEGELDHNAAEVEELRLGLTDIQKKAEVIVREGLIFDFPKATAIIPDAGVEELKGWVGAKHVSQEFLFAPAEVTAIYGITLEKGRYSGFTKSGRKKNDGDMAKVYEHYDKTTGLMYTVCEGYCDFLEEPQSPPIEIDQFFPFFPLSFNDVEDEENPFPPSDVQLIKHQQREINRAREALRQHRIANGPKYAAGKGMLGEQDKTNLQAGVDHEVIELSALNAGQKLDEILQPIKMHPVDPALYDTGPQKEDVLLAVGSQEANLGPTSGVTATESSIAEGSRLSSTASCIDDVDDCFTLLFRAAGQVMLTEVSAETAKKIAGPGAVWPEMSREEIAEELYLELEVGSSGRPNKAQEIVNLERVTPLLIQVPGVTPKWIAKKLVRAVDENIDLSEAWVDGMPSITSMNAVKTPEGAMGMDQGGEGAQNAQQAPGKEGSQAQFPSGA